MPTDIRTQPGAPARSAGAAHHDSVSRAVGAVGLFGIALIHFIDVFDKFKETPYIGVLYVALIVGCLVAARRLILTGDSTAWLLAGGAKALTNTHLQAVDELITGWRGQGGVAVGGGGPGSRLVAAREHGRLTLRLRAV